MWFIAISIGPIGLTIPITDRVGEGDESLRLRKVRLPRERAKAASCLWVQVAATGFDLLPCESAESSSVRLDVASPDKKLGVLESKPFGEIGEALLAKRIDDGGEACRGRSRISGRECVAVIEVSFEAERGDRAPNKRVGENIC